MTDCYSLISSIHDAYLCVIITDVGQSGGTVSLLVGDVVVGAYPGAAVARRVGLEGVTPHRCDVSHEGEPRTPGIIIAGGDGGSKKSNGNVREKVGFSCRI